VYIYIYVVTCGGSRGPLGGDRSAERGLGQVHLGLGLGVLLLDHRRLGALRGHGGGGVPGLEADGVHQAHVSVQPPARTVGPGTQEEETLFKAAINNCRNHKIFYTKIYTNYDTT